jgi:uncharacterized protein
MQTNGLLLDEDWCSFLSAERFSVGLSIDGPQELNDFQRSEGYFGRTMRGYDVAKAHGLSVRFICTFTSHSVKFKEEIFRFFSRTG